MLVSFSPKSSQLSMFFVGFSEKRKREMVVVHLRLLSTSAAATAIIAMIAAPMAM